MASSTFWQDLARAGEVVLDTEAARKLDEQGAAGPEGWARTDSKSGGWKPDSEEYIRSALERGERNALLTGAKERASESRGGSNKREPPWVALYLRRDAEIARENPWLGPYQIEQKIRKEDKIGGLPGRGALRKEALRLRARYRA